MATTTPASSRRPELAADAAWDAALDLGLRRTVYGMLGGLVAAAVLFRECSRGAWRLEKKEKRTTKIHCESSLNLDLSKKTKLATILIGGPGTRGAAVAFGAGFGLGSAYADGRKEVNRSSSFVFVLWGPVFFVLVFFLLTLALFFFFPHPTKKKKKKRKQLRAAFPASSKTE